MKSSFDSNGGLPLIHIEQVPATLVSPSKVQRKDEVTPGAVIYWSLAVAFAVLTAIELWQIMLNRSILLAN